MIDMSDGSLPVSTGKRKKRAGIACDFCRQRKLGCDNEKPKCENCRIQDKSCDYSERAKKIRPTNVQVQHLEEENARLKITLAQFRSQLNNSSADKPLETSNHQWDNFDSGGIESGNIGIGNLQDQSQLPATPVSGSGAIIVPQQTTIPSSSSNRKQPYLSTGDREVHFHGPSSAMFDAQQSANASSPVDRSKSFELLGACIKQRQMEPIDFAAGRLDFDGLDPELGMHLLSVFWNRQHTCGSLVYRPAFMRDMACKGPYFSKILLNAIYFAAAKHSTKAEFRCAQNATANDNDDIELPAIVSPFRRRAEELLSSSTISGAQVPVIMKSDITTIQALLIMSDALFAWCDERSLSWLYSGLAINMIVDLGIHTGRQTPAMKRDASPEDLEIQRRLFWAAFVQDKVQSLYQGRPARLRGANSNVSISFLDDYEELEQFSSLSYSAQEVPTNMATHGISVFEQFCKLSMLMDKILSSIYAENYEEKDKTHLLSTARSLHRDLERWRSALPEHLDLNLSDIRKFSLTPHALSLMSMFHSLVILLHRPFVSDGHIRGTSASVIRDSFATCAAAASEIDGILRVFSQRYCITTVPYFMSYATYVSGTIHVRIAAQSERGSEAHQSLRNCLNVLSEQQGVCRAPRRARQILLRLAGRLNVDLSGDTTRPALSDAANQTGTGNNGNTASTRIRSSGTNVNPPANETRNFEHAFLNSQSDFDLMMSELDIDAIIQSFDFPQSDQAFNTEELNQLASGPVSGVNNVDNTNTNNTTSSTFQEPNSPNQWLFQDPLFGYDSLFTDNTLVF